MIASCEAREALGIGKYVNAPIHVIGVCEFAGVCLIKDSQQMKNPGHVQMGQSRKSYDMRWMFAYCALSKVQHTRSPNSPYGRYVITP